MPGRSDVTLADLVAAELLTPGSIVRHMSGATATVGEDGCLLVNGQAHKSPTMAHLAISPTSRNGWHAWSMGADKGGPLIDTLRVKFRENRPSSSK